MPRSMCMSHSMIDSTLPSMVSTSRSWINTELIFWTTRICGIKDDEQGHRGHTFGEDTRLRCVRTPCGDEEQQTGDEQAAFTSQTRGQHTRQERADDTTDEGTAGRETVQAVGVIEVRGGSEELLQTFLCTGDDCRVVTEQQSSDNSHQDDSK